MEIWPLMDKCILSLSTSTLVRNHYPMKHYGIRHFDSKWNTLDLIILAGSAHPNYEGTLWHNLWENDETSCTFLGAD